MKYFNATQFDMKEKTETISNNQDGEEIGLIKPRKSHPNKHSGKQKEGKSHIVVLHLEPAAPEQGWPGIHKLPSPYNTMHSHSDQKSFLSPCEPQA